MIPKFYPGDKVKPVDRNALWNHESCYLTVKEVRRSRTRSGQYSVVLEVHWMGRQPFETIQPAEDFAKR